MIKLGGLFAATLTPFDSSGHVDLGVVHAHTQWLIEQGIKGLCPCGTTGEFLFLDEAEKVAVIRETISAAQGRVPVIAGVWALRAAEMSRLCRAARELGADGVFLQTPIYYPASDEVIFQWYSAVKAAAGLPTFAYNLQAYASNRISIEAASKLLSAGVIDGIKESSGKEEQLIQWQELFRGKGAVFAASDAFALRAGQLQADGFISALANYCPELVRRAWHEDARSQQELDVIRDRDVKQRGGIPGLKLLMQQAGFDFGKSRLP